jgi:hypothetical protein
VSLNEITLHQNLAGVASNKKIDTRISISATVSRLYEGKAKVGRRITHLGG